MNNIPTLSMTERTRKIRDAIRHEEQHLRERHPWLAYQDWLGLTFFLSAIACMVGIAIWYLHSGLPWWFAIPLMALPISILHELEHDLIHDLYFRRWPWVQNVMFLVIWFCKLSLNPWYRRRIHLKHHAVSGQTADIEERLVGVGLPFGLLRLLVMVHPMGGVLLFRRIQRDVPDFQPWRLTLMSLPTYTIFNVISLSFLGYICFLNGHEASLIGNFLPAWGWPWARDLTVLLVLPNVLRQSSLVLMSSLSHYYGDIPERDVFFQNQIVHHWTLTPFQLFCFNFGATHIVHHYVINQPFYLRQMVAPAAEAEMTHQGARINDFCNLLRENRWGA